MLSQTLYDKEISVTLYRPPQTTHATYTTQVVQGYKETVLDGKRLLYSIQEQAEGDKSLGGESPSSACIQFYASSIFKVFAGYREEADGSVKAVYKRIKYTGKTHYVDTIEQMKTGFSKEGTLFQTGDRVRVKADKSLWSVFADQNFQGKEATTETTKEDITEPAEVLHIKCTDAGLKPDMSLSINLLPGQNCYGAVLKIRNLNLDSVDIRQWTRMVISAGYRTGPKAQYTCPIFTSYIEAPNPDGITTFEGITVGTAEDVLNNQPVEIIFNETKMDLETLIKQVAPAISTSIKVEIAAGDELMKANERRTNLISIEKQTVYAQNGMAVLNWLQTTVSKFVEEMERDKATGEHTSIFMQLVDNVLEVIALNGPNKMPSKVSRIVNLDMVTGATFNGTALTVEAPWNPDLQPGGLFYMPPEFIYGSKLPNILSTKDYRNDDNLYRALTMSISFASVESANKMTVLAVPAQWAGELPAARTTDMRGDLFAAAIAVGSPAPERSIEVGNTGGKDASSVNNIKKQDATNKQMFDENSDIMETWGSWIAEKVDITKGNCLSNIIEYYLFDSGNGPKLTPGSKGEGADAAYWKSKEDFKDDNNQKAIQFFQNAGCKANVVWWPLVVVGTYWKKKVDDRAGASNNWDNISVSNPNVIHENRALYIPVFGTWSGMELKMKKLKDIWKFAYQEYRILYPDLCKVWRAMYYYLGGTDELD